MSDDEYVIYVIPGKSETAWCDRCNLPSVLKTEVVGMTENGFSTIGKVTRCTDCEGDDE